MEQSFEKDNFIKLSYALLNVVAKHLREHFIKLWDQKYPNERWHHDIAKRNLKLQNLLVTRDGNQRQDVYSQKILKGNENEWDISVLIRALLDSGFDLMEGCRNQEDRSIPLRESEEICIIRDIRNKDYAHLPGMLCSFDDFNRLMTIIKQVAQNVFGSDAAKEIYRIEVSPCTPEIRKQVDTLLRGKYFYLLTRNPDSKINHSYVYTF